MNEEELKKEVEKFKSVRKKVLRLNEIIKTNKIYYSYNYCSCYDVDGRRIYYFEYYGAGDIYRCLVCHEKNDYPQIYKKLKLTTGNNNYISYQACHLCKDKTLCTYCLREKQNCIFRTKQKIAFWLCTKTIFPKDIRRLITKLLFKN